ncbi:MAG: hypothetical protein GY765_01945 [bacterium]|nr:hypothetical protein [bacterium]
MKKEILTNEEKTEVKGGYRYGTTKWCPNYRTCPAANQACYYQNLPAGYIVPCILA